MAAPKFEGQRKDDGSYCCGTDDYIIQISDQGNGIHYIEVTDPNPEYDPEESIAKALSWWKGVTKAKIVSIAAFGSTEANYPSLIVVTEEER